MFFLFVAPLLASNTTQSDNYPVGATIKVWKKENTFLVLCWSRDYGRETQLLERDDVVEIHDQ